MPRSFLTAIDLNKNELQNPRLQNLAAAPGSPVEGQVYQDTVAHAAYVYNGSAWVSADASKLSGTIPNGALTTNPLARANHTGTQLSATISDLGTTITGYRINQFTVPNANIALGGFKFTGAGTPTGAGDVAEYSWVLGRSLSAFAAPTADLAMGSHKITGLSAPTVAGDAAEFQWVVNQVQSAAAGIASKVPVEAVATTNLGLTGLAAIDGYTPIAGDRILVTGQTTTTQNGVYNAAVGAWARTTIDGAAPGEIETGALWMVQNGTTYGGSQWRVATQTSPIVIGTTALSIVQFGAANTYTAGNGITLTTNSFSVNPLASGGITVAAGGVSVDTAIVVKKYATTIGDGAATSIIVTHSLGTQDVTMQVRLAATPFSVVECDMAATSTTTATFAFAVAPAASALRVVVHG